MEQLLVIEFDEVIGVKVQGFTAWAVLATRLSPSIAGNFLHKLRLPPAEANSSTTTNALCAWLQMMRKALFIISPGLPGNRTRRNAWFFVLGSVLAQSSSGNGLVPAPGPSGRNSGIVP
ncbi:hypothetical protein D9M71_650230 [compost metagenome]